jgi:signal recognition particle subunit SEC65
MNVDPGTSVQQSYAIFFAYLDKNGDQQRGMVRRKNNVQAHTIAQMIDRLGSTPRIVPILSK